MGVRNRLAQAVIRWAERRASTPPIVGSSLFAGQTVEQDWSFERAVREGYKASHALYTVASDIMDCVGSVPWVVKKQTKTGAELVDTGPLVEMIRSANLDEPFTGLTAKWDLFKSLAGNAYGHLVETDGKLDVWSLRPDRVTIVPDKRGRILRYEYTVDGAGPPYKPKEIVHMKFFDPGDDYYGLAPLQAGARLVDTFTSAVDSNRYAMLNQGLPSMMFVPETALSPEQHAKMIELLNKQVTGSKNARRALFLSEPIKDIRLSLTPVEMDYLKAFDTYEAGICKVFHVHPEAIGALGATFENKKWAIRAKWEGPVDSRLREMRGALNHKLAPWGCAYPPAVGSLYLDYDLSKTPAATAARAEAIELGRKVWDMGVAFDAVDEQLGLGFGPQPGGDIGYLSVALMPAGGSSPTDGRSIRSFNLKTENQMAAHWRAVDRRKQGWERGVAQKVAAQFAVERAGVRKAILAGARDLDFVVDAQRPVWEKLVSTVQRAVIEDFGKKTLADILPARAGEPQETRSFDAWNEKIRQWVEAHAAEHVTEILDTSKSGIRRTLLNAIDAGMNSVDAAKAVDDVLQGWEGGSDVYRAMMIARTEVHSAAGFGAHEAAAQSGVAEEKCWISSNDPPRAREQHMDISGDWIPMDEPFRMPDGAELQYPGDGPPEHVINCRCVCGYRSE